MYWSPSTCSVMPAMANNPSPTPCRHSLRVRRRSCAPHSRASSNPASANRGNSVVAVMNHVLLPGTSRSCSSARDLISGKLRPQNKFARSSIQMA